MALKVGDVLVDNDPRVNGRSVKVIEIGDTQAVCEPETQHEGAKNSRRTIIALARIHDDGKPRKSGFSVRRS